MDKLLLNYLENARIQMECTYSGEYKRGNVSSNKLQKYNDMIKNNFPKYQSVVHQLLHSDNPNAVIWISTVALDMDYETTFAIQQLKKIAQNEKLGIIGFNAEMVLQTRGLNK